MMRLPEYIYYIWGGEGTTYSIVPSAPNPAPTPSMGPNSADRKPRPDLRRLWASYTLLTAIVYTDTRPALDYALTLCSLAACMARAAEVAWITWLNRC